VATCPGWGKCEFTPVRKHHTASDPGLVGIADLQMLTFGQLSQTLVQFTPASMDGIPLLFGHTSVCSDGCPLVGWGGGDALQLISH